MINQSCLSILIWITNWNIARRLKVLSLTMVWTARAVNPLCSVSATAVCEARLDRRHNYFFALVLFLWRHATCWRGAPHLFSFFFFWHFCSCSFLLYVEILHNCMTFFVALFIKCLESWFVCCLDRIIIYFL